MTQQHGRLAFLVDGDVIGAWHRWQDGEAETYRGEGALMAWLDAQAEQRPVHVISCGVMRRPAQLRKNLHVMPLPNGAPEQSAKRTLNDVQPTQIICAALNGTALRWAAARNVPTLPVLAQTFQTHGFREALHHLRLRLTFSAQNFPCVANHGLSATQSMVRDIAFRAERAVAWDLPTLAVSPSVKSGIAASGEPITLLSVGRLTTAKGTGDLLHAAARLRGWGENVKLRLAGDGETAKFSALAEKLGLADHTAFLGRIPQTAVRAEMAAADLVIVPSQRQSAEGLSLPLVEALAARTPVVASDHLGWRGRTDPLTDVRLYPAGDVGALADAIRDLASKPSLYAMMSQRSAEVLSQLSYGVAKLALFDKFLADPRDESGWVAPLSLAAIEGQAAGLPEKARRDGTYS